MSFPRYPKYKPSGVEWLGDMPAAWDVGALRWLTRRYSGGTPDKTNLTYWEGGTVPWLNSGAVNDRIIKEPSTFITSEAFDNSSAKWVPEGALVMALAGQGKTKGMVAQLAISSTCNQSMAAIIPGARVQSRFLFWWLDSNYENIRNMAGGDLRDGLNLELLGNIRCPLPLPAEQTLIAAFLDREIAKIDGLVAEQRRLMELLKEKRQAVISHAVTRGLNPNVPFKPSGIEWLGDVPLHWETAQSRRMFSVRSEPALQTDQMLTASQKYGVLYQSDFVQREGRRVVEVIMGVESLKHVEPDDFIISMRSFQGGLEWSRLRGSTSFHYVMITPIKWVHPPFFAHLFKSLTYIQALQSTTDLIRDGQELRFSNFAQVSLPVVPIEEQVKIAAYLDKEITKFDTLTAEAQRAVDLLQERRTALISAAVTGQIDVREH